jgi:hypothetical protein
MKTMKHNNTTTIAILAIGGLLALNAPAADETKPATATAKKPSGLVAHWNFDEAGEKDVCADASHNGYDATPSTAIKRGAGRFGAHCISLTGDEVLHISNKMPQPSAPMSISVWVKPSRLEGRQYILTYLPITSETRGEYEYALHLDNDGEPRFWIWGHPVKGAPQEKFGLVCQTKLAANKWSHIVVTIGEPTGETTRPSQKEGAVNLTWTMYLNGEVVASEIYPFPPFLPNLAYSIGGKPKGQMAIAGDIDELMIFNRQLTAKEVAGLYTSNALPKAAVAAQSASRTKPRIIVTQDGEKDDRDSFVRFLLYSCDFDVVGIVENNSIFQRRGHSRAQWIQARIDAYAKVLDNLRVHNPDYPDPEYLKSVIVLGNENPGDLMRDAPPYWKHPQDFLTKDTPGSDLIIQTLLDDDPRVVHVPSWGGANTTAYALWKIKTTMPDKWERAASRIRIHSICYNLEDKAQDGGTKWIIDNMPEVKIFQSAWWSRTWNYSSVGDRSFNPPAIQEFMNGKWLIANVKTGRGPLGEMYIQDYVSEGDTPAWLNLVNNGLEAHADYTLGGWGGRAVYEKGNWMVDAIEDPSEATPNRRHAKALYRWIPAAQNDFAARMLWCVTSNYKDANHQPVAKVAGPLVRSVSPGETIHLDATSSTDPDGNQLTFNWWQYYEADSAEARVTIAGAAGKQASFVVPNEPGKQVHIILEVTDNGTPPLTGYQRIICNIK